MTKLTVMPSSSASVHAASQLLLIGGLIVSALVGFVADGVTGLTVFTAAFALAFVVDRRAHRRTCAQTASR